MILKKASMSILVCYLSSIPFVMAEIGDIYRGILICPSINKTETTPWPNSAVLTDDLQLKIPQIEVRDKDGSVSSLRATLQGDNLTDLNFKMVIDVGYFDDLLASFCPNINKVKTIPFPNRATLTNDLQLKIPLLQYRDKDGRVSSF